jgi:hypothetical protein
VVGLDLHAPAAPVALLAASQLRVDVSGEKWNAGDHPLEDGDERGTV